MSLRSGLTRLRKYSAGLAFLASLLIALAPATGSAVELFTVSRVPIDATADSATQARAKALAEGQRAGFQQMLRRLTQRSDWPKLPGGDAATLDQVVQGFEIAEERTTATRYFGSMNVTFRREPIRELLRNAGIPFTEALARPILVVPVLVRDGKAALWQGDNAWRAAWTPVAQGSALIPLLLPKGDAEDEALITAEQAAQGEQAKLAALARRHGATAALVSVATINRGRIDLSSARYGNTPAPAVVEGVAGEPTPENLVRAAQGVAERMEEAWKQQTLLRPGDQGEILAYVPFSGFAEWQRIRERLSGVSEIRRVDIAALNHRAARVMLSFIGNPERLATVLAQRDLDLSGRDGNWELRLSSGGQAGQPRREEEKPAQ